MAKPYKTIVIIDDIPDNQNELSEEISKIVKSADLDYEVEAWNQLRLDEMYEEFSSEDDSESNAGEDLLYRILENQADIAALVVDRDLSKLNAQISESAVVNACLENSIPVCTYHRKPSRQTAATELRSMIDKSSSYSIPVDIADISSAANKIVDVAEGFNEIKKSIDHLSLTGEEGTNTSPSKILASILNEEYLSIFLDQYAKSTSLATFIVDAFENATGEQFEDNSFRDRIRFVLGCWLHNHILEFPGVILNKVATHSYINVSREHFDEHMEHFSECKYNGPFGQSTEYWYRHKIDEFLDEYEDGRDFLKSKMEISEPIDPCPCSVDESLPAGYYCIISRKPISLEKSEGRLSWIPSGADLCRVEKKLYRRIAPLIGF